MADETKENAPADGGTGRPAQSTAAPAAAAAAAALPWYKRPLFWSIVLLALIGLILALLMHQKWLREQEIAAEQEKALQALKQKNDEQEAYLNQMRNLLQKDPCAIEPGLSGITPPEGSALPTLQDRSGTGSPSASGPAPAAPQEKAQGAESPVTPAPEQTKAPAEEKAGQSQAKPGSLAALMEQDTVLILALQDRGVSMGSGFFIAKDTILTNAHVVGAASQAVFINKKIGQVRNATVLLRTQEQGLDFAVLKTDPMDVTPLKISTQTVERTTKVSVFGARSRVHGRYGERHPRPQATHHRAFGHGLAGQQRRPACQREGYGRGHQHHDPARQPVLPSVVPRHQLTDHHRLSEGQ